MTDLRYAMRQVALAKDYFGSFVGQGNPRGAATHDCLQRAMDALERCIEAAPVMEAAYDASQDRMLAKVDH